MIFAMKKCFSNIKWKFVTIFTLLQNMHRICIFYIRNNTDCMRTFLFNFFCYLSLQRNQFKVTAHDFSVTALNVQTINGIGWIKKLDLPFLNQRHYLCFINAYCAIFITYQFSNVFVDFIYRFRMKIVW